MKKSLLYILIHFSSAVIADWITVEHDYNMCDLNIPSDLAAFHLDDDGVVYSASLLIRDVQILKHEPPLTTVNVTMGGCTNDCKFSFTVKVNRDNLSVSSYPINDYNNYKCLLSNYTKNLIPTPKITYKGSKPDSNHVFPTDLTAKYCSEGKHPDTPGWAIKQTEHVAECIDYLTGHEVGTYAASLQFGSGSSFSPDGYDVATYHMINSANKLFNYWEKHHQGFHDALRELSVKITPDNLKELIPPPPPPPKRNLIKEILIPVSILVVSLALGMAGSYLIGFAVGAGWLGAVETTTEIAADIGAAEDVVATTAEETTAEATAAREAAIAYKDRQLTKWAQWWKDTSGETVKFDNEFVSSYYAREGNPDMEEILNAIGKASKLGKRDTEPDKHLGLFKANLVNAYFLPSLMDNVHQSFTGNNQTYSDISSYLSAASENLQFHFEDTLHNNFFAANKSILASFTVNQRMNNGELLDNDEDVYNSIKQNTYNIMSASMISSTLRSLDVEICDPKPSFCGQSCHSGHIYCPVVGNHTNSCVIAAVDSQLKELNLLRNTSDICSNDKRTGWNINHNSNCNINQFKCQ